MDEIDLGKPLNGPSDPTPLKAPESRKFYPQVHIDLDSDQLGDIPECGEITFYFETKEKTVRERDGEKVASVTLELQTITDCEEEEEEPDTSASNRKKAEKALDEYAGEKGE